MTLGIEEEYFFGDRASRDVLDDPPAAILAECEARREGQVSPEFLRAPIEVETRRSPGRQRRVSSGSGRPRRLVLSAR